VTRPQRRAVARIGLAADVLSLLALSAAVIAGAIPAGRMIFPAVTLAIGISIGTACMISTRSRP
jgi:hypothetical protein